MLYICLILFCINCGVLNIANTDVSVFPPNAISLNYIILYIAFNPIKHYRHVKNRNGHIFICSIINVFRFHSKRHQRRRIHENTMFPLD